MLVGFGDPVTELPIEISDAAGMFAVRLPLLQLNDPCGIVQFTAVGFPLTSTENVRVPPLTPPGTETARSRATIGAFGESSKTRVPSAVGVLSPLAARY